MTLIHSGPGKGITLYNVANGTRTELDVGSNITRAEFVSPTQLAVIYRARANSPGPAQIDSIVCSVFEVRGSSLTWLHDTSLMSGAAAINFTTAVISDGVGFNQCGSGPTLRVFDCLTHESADVAGGALGFSSGTKLYGRRSGNTILLPGREEMSEDGDERAVLKLLRL